MVVAAELFGVVYLKAAAVFLVSLGQEVLVVVRDNGQYIVTRGE